MMVLAKIVITLGAVILMELLAIIVHKYVMHGPRGWGWHESHHKPPPGYFEKNDLYAVVFSFIAAGLFITGSLWAWPLWYIGLGFTIYGLLYSFVHDGLVHRRFPFIRWTPKRGYFHRLVLAHRLHHHVTEREGAVSFGFLWAPKVEKLKAELRK